MFVVVVFVVANRSKIDSLSSIPRSRIGLGLLALAYAWGCAVPRLRFGIGLLALAYAWGCAVPRLRFGMGLLVDVVALRPVSLAADGNRG